jgi:hypothetical protein
MGLIDRLNKKDWTPKSNQATKQELKLLLCAVRRSTVFCWHKWVYWTYGEAPRLHRVCKKCYKKQKNRDVINKFIRWIDE